VVGEGDPGIRGGSCVAVLEKTIRRFHLDSSASSADKSSEVDRQMHHGFLEACDANPNDISPAMATCS
jgi:hypothetical protein